MINLVAALDKVQEDNWHVLTKTEGGTISIIKNVNLRTAFQIYEKLNPVRSGPGGFSYSVNKNHVVMTEILGPEDWDGCPLAMKHVWGQIETTLKGHPVEGTPPDYKTRKCSTCNITQYDWGDGGKWLNW